MKMPSLYIFYACKGKQDFHIGDNIKDFMEDPSEFASGLIPCDWGSDFGDTLLGVASMVRCKIGYYDAFGTRFLPTPAENLINESLVIVSRRGTIYGIIPVNHHEPKTGKEKS